jgi:hypothetical protein
MTHSQSTGCDTVIRIIVNYEKSPRYRSKDEALDLAWKEARRFENWLESESGNTFAIHLSHNREKKQWIAEVTIAFNTKSSYEWYYNKKRNVG